MDSIILRSDDGFHTGKMRDACEYQENSGKIEVCREGKVGKVESLNASTGQLAACQSRPV